MSVYMYSQFKFIAVVFRDLIVASDGRLLVLCQNTFPSRVTDSCLGTTVVRDTRSRFLSSSGIDLETCISVDGVRPVIIGKGVTISALYCS